MENYFFESKKSDNFIELFKDADENIWIKKYHIDKSNYDSTLEFCKIIDNAFDTIKSRGGKMHSQYVDKNDWYDFLRKDDRWDLVKKCDDEIYHISCDIDDAPQCILEAFMNDI